MQRYEALDSWRGVCALLVVVFHLNQDINWRLREFAAIQNFDLFVDFFFVLSGFVMASAYEDRLGKGYGIVPFALRRLGRIYPLHIAMLGALLLYALGRNLLSGSLDPREAFDGDIFDFTAIFTNVALLHGIGFENHLTWNYPSWSISAEFYTYLIFALVWALSGRVAPWIVAALIVVCPLVPALIPNDAQSIMMLVRCVFGFALGALVRRAHAALNAREFLSQRRRLATFAEASALAACFAFVTFTDDAIWLAPLVFSIVVFVFAAEAGMLSSALRGPMFIRLGTLSYSIYLLHAVVIFYAWGAVTALERAGLPLTSAEGLWGSEPWIGDIVMAGMLGLIVALSAASYRLIEEPGRRWGQAAADRWRQGGLAALMRAPAVRTD